MQPQTMTPLAASYRAALATAARHTLLRRRRPQSLPERTVQVHEHVIERQLMASYARLFPGAGALDAVDVPSVLVHIAGFPAAMELMAAPDFPLPLLGMVHLDNHVAHHAPVPAEVPLHIAASATNLTAHRAGTTVDLVITVRGPRAAGADTAVLWEGTSTYLGRGVHLPEHPQPQRGERDAFTVPELTARWSLGASTGRDYAALSGDYNPIHLSPLAARALGQRGMIAHGMYLAARMLAGREPAGAGHRWSIAFATPVVLPGEVHLGVSHPQEGTTEITAWHGRLRRPHFTGRIELHGAGLGGADVSRTDTGGADHSAA